MISNRLEDLRAGDILLERKIRSLMNRPRYYEMIHEYLEGQTRLKRAAHARNLYRNVLKIISDFWISSRKNPSLFKDVKEFEPILQTRIENYRDHFCHSLNVFFLGYYITNRLKEVSPNAELRSNDFNLTWMLASTFHDVAYAIQEIDRWMNSLLQSFLGKGGFSFGITQLLPPVYDDVLRLISQWHRSTTTLPMGGTLDIQDWSLYNDLYAKLNEREHGILGGLILGHLLAIRQGFADDVEDKWDFFYNHLPACHAICLHHLAIPIEFEKHPLAFMLSLCDEVQDWGRPSTKKNRDILTLKDVEINGTQDCVEIKLKIKASQNRKKRLRETLSNLGTAGSVITRIIDNKNENVMTIGKS